MNALTEQGLFAKKLDFLKDLRAQLDARENAKLKFWTELAMRGGPFKDLPLDMVEKIAKFARDTTDLPDCETMRAQAMSSGYSFDAFNANTLLAEFDSVKS